MKKHSFAIFIIALQAINTPSTAQTVEFKVEVQLDKKLAELKQERVSIESSFKTREAVCYKNFAVSSCLQELRSEKLSALSEIKRQELEINQQKRQIKSDAVEKKVFEKSKKIAGNEQTKTLTEAPNSSVEKTRKIAKPTNTGDKSEASSLNDPLKNDPSKLAAKRASAASQRVLDANTKQAASQQKAQARARKLNESGAQEAKFNQKLLDAQARKSEIEKAIAEKKRKSTPLPIPAVP